MVIVDKNRLKGNYGATLVAHMLSQRCLVRPVAEGTDIGVDLYCESVTDDGRPFQHFWIQVKTGAQVKVVTVGKTAECSFGRRHLEYWDRQPVPVFALLVPLSDWPPRLPEYIYVVDVTKYLLENPPPYPENQTIRSREDIRPLIPGDMNSLGWFLYQHVPHFTAARKIRDGVVVPVELPQAGNQVTYLATGYTHRFRDEVLDTIRTTATWGALDLMQPDHSEMVPYWKRLIAILQQCDFESHYECHVALGRASLLQRDFVHARECREKAIACVDGNAGLDKDARTPMLALIDLMIPEAELRESQS